MQERMLNFYPAGVDAMTQQPGSYLRAVGAANERPLRGVSRQEAVPEGVALSERTGAVEMQRINNGVAASPLHGVRWHGVIWRKSRHSNPSGNCVEVAELAGGRIAVRNSRHPSGPTLIYSRAEMAAFIEGAKGSEFDA